MTKAFEIISGVFGLFSVLFYKLDQTKLFIVSTISACVLLLCALISHLKEHKIKKAYEGREREQNRFDLALKDYRDKGTPKYMIDNFSDLTSQEKADLYDKVIYHVKCKFPKNNPYRT